VTEIYGPDANQEQPAVSSGTYSYPASVTPVAGSYIVCAWLETDSNDYNGKGDTAAIVTASATATYTTQNTDKLGIALPTTSPTKGIPMTITFAGNATPYDTRGTTPSLYALVRPASGGPCQATFGADLQVSGSTGVTEIYGPDANQEQPAVSSGTYSYSASVTPVASSYIVCAWLETDADDYKGKGDTAAIVTATATASYSVPLPVECVVPSFAGTRLAGIKRKLATNHCGIGQVRSVRRRHTQRGQVIGLSARPGSRHPDGYRVEITVSKGP
jgi:hypothetical protein